jgi:hypothetical protein
MQARAAERLYRICRKVRAVFALPSPAPYPLLTPNLGACRVVPDEVHLAARSSLDADGLGFVARRPHLLDNPAYYSGLHFYVSWGFYAAGSVVMWSGGFLNNRDRHREPRLFTYFARPTSAHQRKAFCVKGFGSVPRPSSVPA